MPNPLHLLNFRSPRSRRREHKPVRVPSALPATDAMFLVLRRMRRPLIVVIVTFSICTAGMMLMPGTDAAGRPYRMTLFDAIYQMVITLTTVGYNEVPYSFSYPQRMWLTLSIFLLVISWAYAIGALFGVLQDHAFQKALATQRFGRQVRRLREPFYLIAGYGQTGRRVASELDLRRRRFVVIDHDESRVEAATIDPLHADVAALAGDCSNPAVLGLGGIDKPNCAGVLRIDIDDAVAFVAGTDNDLTNLALAEKAKLDNPDVYVAVRQQDSMHRPLLDALDSDSVYIPTEIVARETLARIVNPNFWRFIEEAVQRDDEWAATTRDRLDHWCGEDVPDRDVITLDKKAAPAIVEWLTGRSLTIGDITRHPDDRDERVAAIVLMLVRDGELTLTPPDDTELRPDDQLLFAGTKQGLDDLSDSLYSEAALEYLATGHQVPTAYVWRLLSRGKNRRS